MLDLTYRHRHFLRLAGLVLLVAGPCVAIGIDGVAGLVLVGVAAIVLLSVQPLLLARIHSRQMRRRAPRNGHVPGADAQDVDLPSP